MFFRNLTLFRFSPTVAKSLKDLDAALADHALRACGPLDLATRGFVSPFGPDSEVLSHTIGKATLVSLWGVKRARAEAEALADRARDGLAPYGAEADLLRALPFHLLDRRA